MGTLTMGRRELEMHEAEICGLELVNDRVFYQYISGPLQRVQDVDYPHRNDVNMLRVEIKKSIAKFTRFSIRGADNDTVSVVIDYVIDYYGCLNWDEQLKADIECWVENNIVEHRGLFLDRAFPEATSCLFKIAIQELVGDVVISNYLNNETISDIYEYVEGVYRGETTNGDADIESVDYSAIEQYIRGDPSFMGGLTIHIHGDDIDNIIAGVILDVARRLEIESVPVTEIQRITTSIKLFIYEQKHDGEMPEEKDMKDAPITVTTEHFVNGQNIKELTDDQIINFIAETESKIEKLKSVKTKSSTITAKIAEHETAIQGMVELMDSRNK